MVRAGGNAVQFRGAIRVHGKLQHVCARWRVHRGEGQHGSVRSATVGVGAGLRLHPHGSHQRCRRRSVLGASSRRDREDARAIVSIQHKLLRGLFCDAGYGLFLVDEH